MAITVHSHVSTGETYEITLEKTGAAAGRITIRSWKAGQPHSSLPASSETYNLTHIRAKDGTTLVCKADLPFVPDVFDPVVTCWLDPDGGEVPLVRMQVAGKGYAYPLPPEHFRRLGGFIQTAGFPKV